MFFWIRIRSQAKSLGSCYKKWDLDQDPDKMDTGPKHLLLT